jgi:hypothetical protein
MKDPLDLSWYNKVRWYLWIKLLIY